MALSDVGLTSQTSRAGSGTSHPSATSPPILSQWNSVVWLVDVQAGATLVLGQVVGVAVGTRTWFATVVDDQDISGGIAALGSRLHHRRVRLM